jgi:hypothetical protein
LQRALPALRMPALLAMATPRRLQQQMAQVQPSRRRGSKQSRPKLTLLQRLRRRP